MSSSTELGAAGAAAATTGASGGLVPGVSGTAPTLRKHTRRNDSNLALSTTDRSRGGLSSSSAGRGPSPFKPAITLSQSSLGIKEISLMRPGPPRASLKVVRTSSATPAKLNACSKVVMALASSSHGSISDRWSFLEDVSPSRTCSLQPPLTRLIPTFRIRGRVPEGLVLVIVEG